MLHLKDLNIIQNQLRNLEQIPAMIEFVKTGNFFIAEVLKNEKLIEVAHFKVDDKYYIHNGHHRCVAIHLAGRKYIHSFEYYIKEWTYADYNSINFERGYVTPFDIRTEVRIPDLAPFKETINTFLRNRGEEETRKLIHNLKRFYTLPKKYHTVEDLAKAYLTKVVDRGKIEGEQSIYASYIGVK